MLSQRIRSAVLQPAVSSGPSVRCVLPYDLVRDVLETHKLLWGMRVAPRDVHTALRDVHSFESKSPLVQEREEAEESNRFRGVERCPYCNVGVVEVDARGGCRVCSDCGAVLTLRSMTLHHDYSQTALSGQEHKEMTQALAATTKRFVSFGSEEPQSQHLDALEHWNHYTRHSCDEIATIDARLRAWEANKVFSPTVSLTCRQAAALLYPLLRDRLTNETMLRECVSRGATLPVITSIVPEARFACTTCGVRRHDAKSARFHCKKRRRA